MIKRIKNNILIVMLLIMISKLAIQDMLALNASWNVKQFIELFLLFYMYIKIVVRIK